MKSCHLLENEWNWRCSIQVKKINQIQKDKWHIFLSYVESRFKKRHEVQGPLFRKRKRTSKKGTGGREGGGRLRWLKDILRMHENVTMKSIILKTNIC
jgi:hypothetical protein